MVLLILGHARGVLQDNQRGEGNEVKYYMYCSRGLHRRWNVVAHILGRESAPRISPEARCGYPHIRSTFLAAHVGDYFRRGKLNREGLFGRRRKQNWTISGGPKQRVKRGRQAHILSILTHASNKNFLRRTLRGPGRRPGAPYRAPWRGAAPRSRLEVRSCTTNRTPTMVWTTAVASR